MVEVIDTLIGHLENVTGKFLLAIGDRIGDFVGGELMGYSPGVLGLTFVIVLTAFAIHKKTK